MTSHDESTIGTDLDAARRTIAVLKERVVMMQSGSRSSIQRQLDAARRREDDNHRRRALMEMRTAELTRYSTTLESEVAARTLAMRRILNNVTFGFLIVDANLVVQPECTDSCATLLDASTVVGANLVDLLRLDSRAAATYLTHVMQTFEDILPEEVALEQMQSTFRIGARTIRAEARVVRSGTGPVQGLLYTLSDISDLLAAQAESARNRMLVGILRNRDSFVAFADDARALLHGADTALAAGDDASVRSALHTIKGNAAAYDLVEVVDVIHAIEEGSIGSCELAQAHEALASFFRAHADIIGFSFAEQHRVIFSVSEPQLAAVQRIASEVSSDALRYWVASIAERPARAMLGPLDTFAARLADRVGKSVELAVTGGDTLLDDVTMRPVMQTVVHLIRNAIDHGIEAPEARGAKGSMGALTVSIERTPDSYVISVSDDGAGIDVVRLGRRALEKGIVTEAMLLAMSDVDKRALIFHDGVSTADAVTNISGRGVGMCAVLSAVHAVGGRVGVTSELGSGTTIRLQVPRPAPLQQLPRARRSTVPGPARISDMAPAR